MRPSATSNQSKYQSAADGYERYLNGELDDDEVEDPSKASEKKLKSLSDSAVCDRLIEFLQSHDMKFADLRDPRRFEVGTYYSRYSTFLQSFSIDFNL